MTTIELCPQCATVAYPVPVETVFSLVKNAVSLDKEKRWSACTNKRCNIAYFSEGKTISVNEVKVRLWYKDKSGDVPICYCSMLTRDEIRNAVAQGALTIDDVQKMTGKNITGKCRNENPLGQCCRNVFLWTINNVLKNKKEEL